MDSKDINPSQQPSVLELISHASVVIRNGDNLVLTDPWYLANAFSAWVQCPPPVISPDVWGAIAKTENLCVVLSHVHADHTEPEFLKTLGMSVPIFVAEFPDHHFVNFMRNRGFKNVTEIGDGGVSWKSFKFQRMLHHSSYIDSIIAIETDDCFILHGNDAWDIKDEPLKRLLQLKPKNKPSLLMGQGGSASGYPLTYVDKPWAERLRVLKEKNIKMLNGLAAFGERAQFDRVLAYACFMDIKVPGKKYSLAAPPPTAQVCKEATGRDFFIDLSPGDVYIPAEHRVIQVLKTLHVPFSYYKTHEPRPSSKKVAYREWQEAYDRKLADFMGQMKSYFESCDTRVYPHDELALNFEMVVTFEGEGKEISHSVAIFDGRSGRKKVCRAEASVMADVLDRNIPFEDLYSGYMGEWSRQPEDRYNRPFLNCLLEFGYVYKD